MQYTWSYSSISMFMQCPRKYFHMRVARDVVEPPQPHLMYGTEVHKAAEDYAASSTPIPEKYAFIKPYVDMVLAVPGDRHCEYEMGLTKKFEPCAFNAEDVWFRGIADLLVIDGDTARIVDYKTGKNSVYADTKQLELLSLLVFKHFPQVRNVKAALLFLVARDLVKAEFTQEREHIAWQSWLKEIDRLEQCYEKGIWNPRPNFTCRKFCAVKQCEHNGNMG